MKRNNQSFTTVWKSAVAVVLIVIFVAAWQMWADSGTSTQLKATATLTDSLLNVKIPDTIPSEFVKYSAYQLSFNPQKHIPNWVSWELTGKEVKGTEPRKDKFVCDENVPGCPDPWDYSYSGYDRGHMAPAGDMKFSREAMAESFYLTNICPQAKKLNTGAWKKLEEKCRRWAVADSAIIVICGPVPGDPVREYIGDSRVAVPQKFFKVILSPFANPVRGIGFIMNNGYVDGGMQKSAVSIDEVERITGFDFFSALPDEIENKVESQCDFPYWSTIR